MRVFITGGTGLIGRSLVARLRDRGDTAVVLSRRADEVRSDPALAGAEVVAGDPTRPGAWCDDLARCDAVIHLAGQPVFGRRWTDAVKRAIRDSRVEGTNTVVDAIAKAGDAGPRVLVSASAIGYYGPHGDEELTENSPPGDDFLARVGVEWEAAAHRAEAPGRRVAIVRVGVVLDRSEGALGVLTPIFKWVPGGAAPVGSGDGLLGSGRQWMSWIHRDDIVGIFLMALDNPAASGPLNGTAPEPERNVDFSQALASALHRPMLPVGPPDFLLRMILGDVAQVVTRGQKVAPDRARELGYHFLFPSLPAALADIFGAE
jgi:uncharacterized protein (TIGR01777 family)